MATEGIIAAGLKRFRKDFKLSQKEVAGLLGITSQAYQNYEYGKGAPTAVSVLKLADAYNVSTDYLLGRIDDPQPVKFDKKEVQDAFALRDAIKTIMTSSRLVEPQATA